MAKILEIGSRIGTPMALGGFVAAAFLGVAWLILKKVPRLSQGGGLRVIILIIKYFFWLAVLTALLGFLGYLLSGWSPAVKQTASTVGSNSPVIQADSVSTINATVNYGIGRGQGPRSPTNLTWRPQELPEECKGAWISVGGAYTSFPVSWLKDFPEKLAVIVFPGDVKPIRPYIKDNRLYVDVDIPAPLVGLIKVRGDKVSQIPPLWDMNHNSNAVEIVNESSTPIYQVFYKQPDHVRVLGIFTGGGMVASFGEGRFSTERTDATPSWLGLKPIFKYPAWQHPGEYADK